jgi:hypothetical protein
LKEEGGISDPCDLADFFEERAAHLEFDCEIDPQPWIGAQIPYTRRQAEGQAWTKHVRDVCQS